MGVRGGLVLILALGVALTLVAADRKPTDLEAGEASVKYFETFFKNFKDAEVRIYRIDKHLDANVAEWKTDEKHLSSWSILEQKPVEAITVPSIRAALLDPASYQRMGPMCFYPGMALSFKKDDVQINQIICLHCGWIYQYKGTERSFFALTPAGAQALKNIYEQYFKTVPLDDGK